MKINRHGRAHFAVLVVLALVSGAVSGQSYPMKPIRVVVSSPAGGGVDLTMRLISPSLDASLGQPLVIDPRPGAGGIIGSEIVAKAEPNGYTLLATYSNLASNAALNPHLPYDAIKDFAPIALLLTVPNVLVVNPSLPVKTVSKLIALAKQRPGELNYSSGGNGTPPHLSAELFNMMAGIKLTHVPYKLGPVRALIGGEVQLAIISMVLVLPHAKSGRMHVIAIASLQRSPLMPQIPTIDESGLRGYDSTVWYALLAPAKTPQPILERLRRESMQALQRADVRESIRTRGAEPGAGTPKQLAALIKTDIEKWRKVVKATGMKVD